MNNAQLKRAAALRRMAAALALGSALLLGTVPAMAQGDATPTLYASDGGAFNVPVNKSGVIRLDQNIKRLSVGNPGVADVLVLRTREIYVVGKKIGSTNVTVWDANERIFATVNINVTQDLESLKAALNDLLPGEPIGVQSAQERIILTGRVSGVGKMDAALQLAEAYLSECIAATSNVLIRDNTGATPVVQEQGGGGRGGAGGRAGGCSGSVINLMTVGGSQQVMLEVKVAEVVRSELNRLDGGINFLRFTGSGGLGAGSAGIASPSTLGPPVTGAAPLITAPQVVDRGLIGSVLSSNGNFFQAFLDISRRNDLAKILAEPTLTTMSGQEAQFLSGGEFPIPVPSGQGDRVTIEFKDFGVGVKFLPTVLDSGHINLRLDVSVSEITQANTVTLQPGTSNTLLVIPSLNKRSATSTVELANGQTIGIAGLISDNVREFVDKFPGLGDIPVLGAFFRSQEFRRDETELVMFVTPHLAKPINSTQVRLPTDAFVPPSALEFYLMGYMESGMARQRSPMTTAAATGSEARSDAEFGHAQ